MEFYIIKGETFKYKAKLKELGCKWNHHRLEWVTDSNHIAMLVAHELKKLKVIRVGESGIEGIIKPKKQKIKPVTYKAVNNTTTGKDYIPSSHHPDCVPWEECICQQLQEIETSDNHFKSI